MRLASNEVLRYPHKGRLKVDFVQPVVSSRLRVIQKVLKMLSFPIKWLR